MVTSNGTRFACPLCSATFAQRDEVRYHLRFTHPQPRKVVRKQKVHLDDAGDVLPGFHPTNPLPKGR